MTYVIGGLAGIVFGAAVGWLKNLFLWRKYLREEAVSETDPSNMGGVFARAFISYIVNILALVAVFLMRDTVPFDGIACLIGTAIALSAMNKILTVKQKKWEEQGKEALRK